MLRPLVTRAGQITRGGAMPNVLIRGTRERSKSGAAECRRRSLSARLLLVLSLSSVPLSASAGASTQTVEVWLTAPDKKLFLNLEEPLRLKPGVPKAAIVVDPAIRYQRMAGVGAAISDASAHLIQRVLSESQRAAFIKELFQPGAGVAFSLVRMPIGSSDFSLSHYSFNDLPAGEHDPELERFSISPAKSDLLPVLRAALAANPALTVMATPWSPPAWMKTSGSLLKGTLRKGNERPFGMYLRKTVQEFGAQGVPIHYLSIQNEPDHEPGDYPGMRLSAEQRAYLIGEHVGPEFARAGLTTKLLEWDHNWDQPEQPLKVLADPKAAKFISGVAWHCYGGDVAAQAKVPAIHPDKEVFFTECSGGEWSPAWPEAWPWNMRNIIIGSTRQGARGVLLWNLALDEKHGPRLGGCKNCRGVVTIDSKTGEITRNPEYYALGHLSRFVRPGASRIESPERAGQVLTVAFDNGDSHVLIAFNDGNSAAPLSVGTQGRHFSYTLAAKSAATFRWPSINSHQ